MKTVRILFLSLLLLGANTNSWALEISDVSDKWRFRENIISAFPKAYEVIPKEENANIIRVFHYFQGDSTNPLNERRIEVFYTGGDWMEFGLTYFVANSPNRPAGVHPETSGAYFLQALSTSDREEGAEAPEVDPLDAGALKTFIEDRFLDDAGNVREGFKPL